MRPGCVRAAACPEAVYAPASASLSALRPVCCMRLSLSRPDVAFHVRCEIGEIDELVGLAAKFVSDRRSAALERRDDGHALALPLKRRNEVAKCAVAREQDDVIGRAGEFERVDGQFDSHVGIDVLASIRCGSHPCGFRHQRKTIVVEPVDQRPVRCDLILLNNVV